MKKITLLILAIALTISSCKNYDDEFAAASASIAELQTQVAGFSTLQANLTALQASVASLQTTVNALPTSQVDLSGLEAALATSLANIASLQTALNTVVSNYVTSADLAAAQEDIDALITALAIAQENIAELLSGNNVYDGDLTITNAAELTFAKTLENKVTIINGNVTVDIVTNSLDAAEVSSVTSKIMSVTGNTDIATDASLDFSSLALVGGFYHVTGARIYLDKGVSGKTNGYSPSNGADINDDALTYVGDHVVLDYDGGYNQPNLKVVGSYVQLFDYPNGSQTKPSLSSKTNTGSTNYVGTLTVDFSGLTDCDIMFTAYNSGTVVYFSSATSVKLNAGVRYVSAPEALTVDLLATNNKNGLTVSATKAGSVITIAGRVDNGLSGEDLEGQGLYVTGSPTSVLNAANVSRLSYVTVTNIETALSFPALTKAIEVTADKTVSFIAPLLVANTLTATVAKTVTIGSAAVTATALENLTFTALEVPYTAATTLKTANVTGKAGKAGAFTSTTATLISAAFAGELDAVYIRGTGTDSETGVTLDKLTTLTTTGAIDVFDLMDSDVITSISLGHSHIAGGGGSELYISYNDKLVSLTTSTDYLKYLYVINNKKLTAMNFASYKNVISAGNMTIAIYGNKLSGDYSNAVAATGTTPYVETVITSADLLTLKPFMAAYKAALAADPATTAATYTMGVDMWNVDPAATTGNEVPLYTAMAADNANPIIDGTTGINTIAEFLLIQ